MNVEKAITEFGNKLRDNGTPFVLMAKTDENTIVYMGATAADQTWMGNKWVNKLKEEMLDGGCSKEFTETQLKLMLEDEELFNFMMMITKAKAKAAHKDEEDEDDETISDGDEDEARKEAIARLAEALHQALHGDVSDDDSRDEHRS